MNAVEKIVQDTIQGVLGTPEKRAAEAERTASLIAESQKLVAQWDARQAREKAEAEDVFLWNNIGAPSSSKATEGASEPDDFIRANLPGAA